MSNVVENATKRFQNIISLKNWSKWFGTTRTLSLKPNILLIIMQTVEIKF